MENLKNIKLINPVHIELVSNGHGEFPDSYKLTEKGISLIKETLLSNIIGELELSENPTEYSDSTILESIKCLIKQI